MNKCSTRECGLGPGSTSDYVDALRAAYTENEFKYPEIQDPDIRDLCLHAARWVAAGRRMHPDATRGGWFDGNFVVSGVALAGPFELNEGINWARPATGSD